MREGMVLWDAAGRELWACPNVDARAGAEAAELVRRGRAQRIYDTAGDWISITAPARLLWLRAHAPEIHARVAHVTMLSDWVLARLCGRFVTDPSVGSSSGMFDLARRTWSPEIIDLVGLPASAFPEVVEPGTAVGAVSAAAAADTGLAPGTTVVMGGADTQLGLVGIGVTRPDSVTIVGGTFWQQTVVLDRPLIDPGGRLRTLCHAVPGQWMMEGIGFYSGLTMRWFRDGFCEHEKALAGARGVDPYQVMEELAATAPAGSVLGLFSNLMNARRWVHGAPSFVGFDVADPARSGRNACVRAILESAAYVSRGHLDVIEELTGRKPASVVLTGGAARGRLWPQIVADVLGVPVRVPVVKESTALGAALYAGLGAGLNRDREAVLGRKVRFERTVEPDAAARAAYQGHYERWRAAYARVLELTEAGLAAPLWRAAGA
jgi:autoinducer 2 (AI-2) kinase